MRKLISKLLVVLALVAGAGSVHAAPVTVDGKRWLQPNLFLGLSWTTIATSCDPVSGICAGTLPNGVNVDGYTWASLADINALFNHYLNQFGREMVPGGNDPGQGDIWNDVSTFFDEFEPTDPRDYLFAWTRTLRDDGLGYAFSAVTMQDFGDGRFRQVFDTSYATRQPENSDTTLGAWFWRTPTPSVSVNLVAGDPQECSEPNGANVALEANVDVVEGDPAQSIEWEVNGTQVAEGDSVNVFVPLGVDNIIGVYVMTVSGTTLSDTATITIEDTIGPDISLAFVDPKSGIELSQAQQPHQLLATYQVTDTCDPAPTVAATAGPVISSGDAIRPRVSNNGGVTVTIEGSDSPNLQLTVGAEDLSGNESEETISIPVIK